MPSAPTPSTRRIAASSSLVSIKHFMGMRVVHTRKALRSVTMVIRHVRRTQIPTQRVRLVVVGLRLAHTIRSCWARISSSKAWASKGDSSSRTSRISPREEKVHHPIRSSNPPAPRVPLLQRPIPQARISRYSRALPNSPVVPLLPRPVARPLVNKGKHLLLELLQSALVPPKPSQQV